MPGIFGRPPPPSAYPPTPTHFLPRARPVEICCLPTPKKYMIAASRTHTPKKPYATQGPSLIEALTMAALAALCCALAASTLAEASAAAATKPHLVFVLVDVRCAALPRSPAPARYVGTASQLSARHGPLQLSLPPAARKGPRLERRRLPQPGGHHAHHRSTRHDWPEDRRLLHVIYTQATCASL